MLISGCASTPPPKLLPEEKKVEVSTAVMEDCGNLREDLQINSSFEDTLIMHAEDAKLFVKCKELNNSKKEIIKRFLLNERQK